MSARSRSFAHALAVWARNPTGFKFVEVMPDRAGVSLDDVWEWAPQEIRDAGLVGDALDEALDNVETTLQELARMTTHTSHTPGPRCTCTISNRSGAHQYEGERWQRIEYCPLHAAAPALLEALEAHVKAFDAGLLTIKPEGASAGFIAKARAAIKLARGGESNEQGN